MNLENMPKEDRVSIDIVLSALKITSSLFTVRRGTYHPNIRVVYKLTASNPPEIPLNREEVLLHDFIRIADNRNISAKNFSLDRPYWQPGIRYNPLEIYTTAIQFTDDHSEPLAVTTLPPETDVKKYSEAVFASEQKLTLPSQFDKLLDITDNNIIGAANLGCIASRIQARAADTRAYPSILVDEESILDWNRKVANFETYGESGRNDAAGDTYYFWTHFFAASTFEALKTVDAEVFSRLFAKGTEMMRFVRRTFVGQQTITEHREASILGRNIGLAVFEHISTR